MLGIGLVGLGGIAKSHLTALKIAEDEGFARCVAAADLFEDVRESHRKEWDIPAVYAIHHKLLEDPNVDAVAIVLGHHLHADLPSMRSRLAGTSWWKNPWRRRLKTVIE